MRSDLRASNYNLDKKNSDNKLQFTLNYSQFIINFWTFSLMPSKIHKLESHIQLILHLKCALHSFTPPTCVTLLQNMNTQFFIYFHFTPLLLTFIASIYTIYACDNLQLGNNHCSNSRPLPSIFLSPFINVHYSFMWTWRCADFLHSLTYLLDYPPACFFLKKIVMFFWCQRFIDCAMAIGGLTARSHMYL